MPTSSNTDHQDSFIQTISVNFDGNQRFPENTTSLVTRDREMALRDLKGESYFQPNGDAHGPYDVLLGIEENRMVFRISNSKGDVLPMLVLSLKPYARLIKDYFMIVESYDEAARLGGPSKLEAIDMGRRAIHNEGAELLIERLKEKIDLDFETARKIFTLICVLHFGKIHILR